MNKTIIICVILQIFINLLLVNIIYSNPDKVNNTDLSIYNNINNTKMIYELTIISKEFNQNSSDYIIHVYDCSDMSIDLKKILEKENYNVLLVSGNHKLDNEKITQTTHAWLLVEIEKDKYIAIESTTGELIFNEKQYYEGFVFKSNDIYKILKG